MIICCLKSFICTTQFAAQVRPIVRVGGCNDLFTSESFIFLFNGSFPSRKLCFSKFRLRFLVFQRCQECCSCFFFFEVSLLIHRAVHLIYQFTSLFNEFCPMLICIFDRIHIFRNTILKWLPEVYHFNDQAPSVCRACDLLFVCVEIQVPLFRLFSRQSFSKIIELIMRSVISFQ